MNTRRYPRTLNEAFGPYADRGPIVEPQDPMPREDRIVVSICGVVGVGLVCLALVGWI